MAARRKAEPSTVLMLVNPRNQVKMSNPKRYAQPGEIIEVDPQTADTLAQGGVATVYHGETYTVGGRRYPLTETEPRDLRLSLDPGGLR